MGDVTLEPGAIQVRTELRLLRTILDQLPALVAYWDVDCRNLVANQAYVEYFGLSPEQILGVHIRDVLGPDVYARNLPFITGVLAGEEQLFDRTLIDQRGQTRHTQASYVPDLEDGVVKGFFVLVTDVTPRVEAQRAMDEAQEIAKLGSWELEVATGAVTWSRHLYTLMGADPGDPSDRVLPPNYDYYHPDDRERIRSVFERAGRTGESCTASFRVITLDGRELEVVGNARPVVGRDGEVTRMNGTVQDVTEANASARELARINSELRGANELNADVIAMLGHDLRNPLSGVLAHLEDLELSWASLDDSERLTSLTRARAASERLGAVIERILTLAASDAGAITPLSEHLDLAEVLPEIVSETALRGQPTVDIDPAVAQHLTFDRVHLQQILANLLTNAFRYGAEPVGIHVTTTSGGVAIAVTDAGAGVPPGQADALFTRFARTGVRQMAARGTGFGLYLAERLADANGARLAYRPAEEDQPHAFVLTIPT